MVTVSSRVCAWPHAAFLTLALPLVLGLPTTCASSLVFRTQRSCSLLYCSSRTAIFSEQFHDKLKLNCSRCEMLSPASGSQAQLERLLDVIRHICAEDGALSHDRDTSSQIPLDQAWLHWYLLLSLAANFATTPDLANAGRRAKLNTLLLRRLDYPTFETVVSCSREVRGSRTMRA